MFRSTNILLFCLSVFLLPLLSGCLRDKDYYYSYTGLDLEGARTTNGYPEMTTVPTSVNLFGIKLHLFPVEGTNEEEYDYNEGTLVNTNPIIGMKTVSTRDERGPSREGFAACHSSNSCTRPFSLVISP